MASTDARPVPQKNVAYRAVFPIYDADGDLVTGAASLDSEVSKDQGAFADCTNEATEIATSSGMYYLDLTATEMNADCVAVIVKTGTAGAKTTVLVLYPEEAGDIRVNVTAFGGTAGTFNGGRPEVNASHAAGTAWNSGAIGAATLASDTIAAAKIAAGAITAAKFAAGAIDATAIATGAIDADAIAADAITAAKIATGAIDADAIADNAIDAGAIAAAALNGKGDWNIGKTGYSLSAAGVQAIWDALTTALTTASSIGKLLVDNVNATISSRLASASYTAPLDAAGTRAAVGLASANLDTQLDAIPTAAEINAEVVDALATDTYAEPGQGTPAATASLSAKIGYLYKAWRNRTTQTATEYALYGDDGVTKDQEAAVSDDGTTFVRAEVQTGL